MTERTLPETIFLEFPNPPRNYLFRPPQSSQKLSSQTSTILAETIFLNLPNTPNKYLPRPPQVLPETILLDLPKTSRNLLVLSISNFTEFWRGQRRRFLHLVNNSQHTSIFQTLLNSKLGCQIETQRFCNYRDGDQSTYHGIVTKERLLCDFDHVRRNKNGIIKCSPRLVT